MTWFYFHPMQQCLKTIFKLEIRQRWGSMLHRKSISILGIGWTKLNTVAAIYRPRLKNGCVPLRPTADPELHPRPVQRQTGRCRRHSESDTSIGQSRTPVLYGRPGPPALQPVSKRCDVVSNLTNHDVVVKKTHQNHLLMTDDWRTTIFVDWLSTQYFSVWITLVD